ncbi:hypothetical protein HMPREF1980_02165 [Actinomyces sp. oral taxon 172 str. F0311]|nr:hypothetical protein HMPREF1980_02165 [Actinomyces sp. oral taxon 172 str. F0311]
MRITYPDRDNLSGSWLLRKRTHPAPDGTHINVATQPTTGEATITQSTTT